MSNYKPYPKYKESGVAWLGEVPEGWGVSSLKFLLAKPLMYGANESADRENPNDPRYIRITDIKSDGTLHNDTFRSLPMSIAKPYLLENNSLLLARSGATVGKTFLYDESWGIACFAGYLIKATIDSNKANSKFVSYFTTTTNYWQWLSSVQIQATIENVSAEKYDNLKIPYPPLKEQVQITNYLNQKTKKIDTLIEKQQTLIELLKEKRQALISHVVTKGLDDSVPMKESGVAWLGEVPEGWEISKLKFIFTFSKGLTITKAHLVDEGIPCVNYGEIHSKYGFEVSTDKHKLKCVKNSYLSDSKSSLLSKGDFVFADTSEDIEGAGNFTHVSSGNQIFAGYHTIIARQVNNNNFRFLAYLMDSETFRTQIRLSVKGVKVFSMTQFILKASHIWLPKVKEQIQIANYLDEKTKKIDTLIEKSKHSIELLKERRTALISAVVTGKVDVRD